MTSRQPVPSQPLPSQPVQFSRRRLLGGAAAVSVAAMWPTSPFGISAAGAQGVPGPATQPVL